MLVMLLPGQTGLDRVDSLPAGTREQLQGLWIESVEEVVALIAAMSSDRRSALKGAFGGQVPDAAALSSRFIDPARREQLMQAGPGGGLGCCVDPAVLQAFEEFGTVAPGRGARRATLAGSYPSSVRLMDRMFPVKNQGMRGTCVAFASVALREYLYQCQEEFSEQFLYWACKELDGAPGPGTWVHTAMSALSEYGVCRTRSWPYNPSQDDDNESQGPPPPGAVDDASRYRMRYARTVEPGLIDHYKSVLAGSGSTPGMPVSFATLVFYSWYMSSETRRTGKITMPLPGESPLPGGHAWCVVGYVDNASAPGGGYFIVRNSWGSGWASDSPEAVGHAIMPYAYVERYGLEAYTGAMLEARAERNEGSDGFEGYVMTLDRERRDTEDALLTAGTPVLMHPAAPDKIMKDTPENRRRFREQDFTWDASTRVARYFPPISGLGQPDRDEIDRNMELKQSFTGTVDRNLDNALKRPLPDTKLPRRLYLLPWEPRASEIVKENASRHLCNVLRRRAGVPAGLDWPAEWEQLLAQLNHAAVYRLRGAGVEVHVCVAYVTPVLFRAGETPRIVQASSDTLRAVEEAYAAWRDLNPDKDPRFTYYAVGVGAPFRQSPDALGDSMSIKTVSYVVSRDGTGYLWKFQLPSRFEERPRLSRFLSRLKPETVEQRAARLERRIRRLLDDGFAGNLTAVKLARELGDSVAEVLDAFLVLEKQGDFGLYETEDRLMAVERLRPPQQSKQRRTRLSKSWFQRHLLLIFSPPISVVIWMLKDALLGRPFTLKGFLLALPMAYIGALIDRYLIRFREPKE